MSAVEKDVAVSVEVWVDVVCPWCYIGKRRLEAALEEFAQADQVEVAWRSYQLDPAFPAAGREPVHEYLSRMTGQPLPVVRQMTDQAKAVAREEGLEFDAGRAWMVNTFDAHRIGQLAAAYGLRDAVYERLMRAHHVEGRILDDPEVLVALAVEAGVPGDEVRQVLAGDGYAAQVRADVRSAAANGANGVPFFVVNGAHGLSGAQLASTLLAALETAARAPHS